MNFNIKSTLWRSLDSALSILRLIIPIYIVADILFFYDFLNKLTSVLEPLTSFLNLPAESSLALVSGMFFNLYAAIAFAAPLGLSAKEWTILAVFLGICHELMIETAIMQRLKIPIIFSLLFRLTVGILGARIVALLPDALFGASAILTVEPLPSFSSFLELFINSLKNAFILALEVVLLVCGVIVLLDFLKTRAFIQNYSKKINVAYSLLVGTILGTTYGAGILIDEYKNSSMSLREIWFVGTFLMVCHAIIEDTIIFVIFGANIWIIVAIRVVLAILFAFLVSLFFHLFLKKST